MKTKKLFYLLCGLSISIVSYTVEPEVKHSKEVKLEDFDFSSKIETTSVKDQYKTGTCWSFSTLSFLESELIRKTGHEYDFSEMFVVRKVYTEKALRYVRMHGTINFAAGGEPNDVVNIINNYGVVPELAYTGLKVDSLNHTHTEMDAILKEYVNTIIKNPSKQLSNVWLDGFNAILDSYLGEVPNEFKINKETYTAKSFGETLDLKPDDYVIISSFSYKPYYSTFILEVPDNWSWGKVYNVPLNELLEITDYALANGYSATWSADISEKGFSFKNGMAVAPEILYEPATLELKVKHKLLPENERKEMYFSIENPIKEISVDEKKRQKAFDDYSTQDDHGMHILGLATDKNGREFYYVKNSWGTNNPYGGYLFVSKAYFKYKTIAIMLHKDAVPVSIKKKLNL
jgi:bleomycin hydrolase